MLPATRDGRFRAGPLPGPGFRASRAHRRQRQTLGAISSLSATAGVLVGLLRPRVGSSIIPVSSSFTSGRGSRPSCACTSRSAARSRPWSSPPSSRPWPITATARSGGRWSGVCGPGFVAGAALGAVLAEHAPGRFLRVFFGLFDFLVAAQLALAPGPGAYRELPGTGGMWLVGTGIGALLPCSGSAGGR